MERIKVESSNLKSIGYSEKELVLEIEFKSWWIYQYKNVPLKVYNSLIQAESLGSFFSKNIKWKFEYEKLK